MNKFIVVCVAVCALIGVFFVFNAYIYQEKQAEELGTELPARDVYLNQFEDESIGIAFDYPGGPDGYVLDDTSSLMGEEVQGARVVKVYRILNLKEKSELENSEAGREGPPSIQLMVFKNNLNQSASMWVDTHPEFSNIEMATGEVDRDGVVGGANAVRYTTDGLYMTETVVIAHGDFVYQLTGGYLEPNSIIHQDFKALVDSVRFVPSSDEVGAGAKIDVQVACESALAYMQFQSGEQADQFVAECVAGEHPEVIERYIDDLGVDGATI
jgi:hypothetical protein